MKHRIAQVGTFLFAGAIINILVAWGCSYYITNVAFAKKVDRGISIKDGVICSALEYRKPGASVIISRRLRTPTQQYSQSKLAEVESLDLPWWTGFGQPTDQFDHKMFAAEYRFADARGWPMISMWFECKRRYHDSTGRPTVHGALGGARCGLPDMDGSPQTGDMLPRRLPLWPAWPGFIVNTFFYTAVAWLVSFIPRWLIRPSRRSRGLCPRCAYDVRGKFDTGCPECGWNRA